MKVQILLSLLLCSVTFGQLQAQKLTEYAKQRQQEIADRIRVEQKYYNDACSINTLEAYEGYLKRYPQGKYVIDINKRISDYALWEMAKKANTIYAYDEYIIKSEYRFFVKEANVEIEKLKSIAYWNGMKNTADMDSISVFILKYPNSPVLSEAKRRMRELKALKLHEQGNLVMAYKEFLEAGGRDVVASNNRKIYDECEEYYLYKQLSADSPENMLSSFIAKFPSSTHRSTVSNWLAVSKAKKFTLWSSETTFSDAMMYATNDITKRIVRGYANDCRRSYKRYKKRNRKVQHDRNGKLVQFGFELIDVGFNPTSYDDTDSYIDIVYYYNIGFGLKIGNFADPVQFEVGAKLGWVGYTVWHDYDDETGAKFHMPLYAKLKINLSSVGTSCKWYLSAIGYYNSLRNEFLENEYALSGGMGFAWKHWDCSMFYKADLNNKYSLDNDYLGMSLSYYF